MSYSILDAYDMADEGKTVGFTTMWCGCLLSVSVRDGKVTLTDGTDTSQSETFDPEDYTPRTFLNDAVDGFIGGNCY